MNKVFDEYYLMEKAVQFAVKKHFNQKDDSGKPYMQHIYSVYDILRVVTDDYEILTAAFLHDTLEDTNTTYEELVENFGKSIADIVLKVTHEGKKDERGYYFPRLNTTIEDKKAVLLKFADRLSNLSRMDVWDVERQEHYLRKSKFWRTE